MSKIKILVDAHVFDESYQGTTTYIKGLYTALVKNDDFEITLAAKDIVKLRSIFNNERFKFIALPSSSKLKRLAIDLPHIIKTNQFDFAHFQYITPFKKDCKFINTIHDILFLDFPEYFPFSYRWSKKFLFKYSANKSDLILTVSDFSKNALVKHFEVKPENIVITPNAAEVTSTEYVDIKSKYKIGKYILFVSRLEPRKNHYLMLKSFVELELYKKGYHLVFIGRIKDVATNSFNAYYNSLSNEVKSQVISLENISHNELNNFYKQADLFVYPSLAEGFGIPPLEAAMLDCKVLCSNQTAMSDFDFFGQYHFNPHDIEELKTKIIRTLNELNYPFEQIKADILRKYNWTSIAETFSKSIKSFV